MPAQISDSIADWSTTAGSNQPSGSANVGPDLDDNLRAMQVAVRQTYTRGSIASAATCDIGTVDAELITITGTTGISSLGTTLGASGYGVHKLLTFAGALTLTHSASLSCITSANITTAAGDSCMVEYGASGWTMLWYARKSGVSVAVQSFAISDLSNATAAKTLTNSAFKQTWNWTGIATDAAAFELSATGSGSSTLLRLKGTSDFLLEVRETSLTTDRSFYVSPSGGLTAGGATMVGAGNGTGHSIKGNNAAGTSGGNGGSVLVYGGNGDGVGNGGSVTIAAGNKGASGAAGTVQLANGAATNVVLSDTATTMGGNTKLVLDQKHLFVDNTNGSPTITAGGGAGGTISGSDVAFEVTFGTGSPTSVTVTFANAWATAPLVLVSGTQSGQVLHYSAATNTVQILSSTAFSSGTKISVLCIGKQ